jgi:hypothetical protein
VFLLQASILQADIFPVDFLQTGLSQAPILQAVFRPSTHLRHPARENQSDLAAENYLSQPAR